MCSAIRKQRGVTYLGINIALVMSVMVDDNSIPLVFKTKYFGLLVETEIIICWQNLGCKNDNPTTISIHFLEYDNPLKWLLKIHQILNHFIWDGRKARIKSSLMQASIENVGLSVPNLVLYYSSSRLAPVMLWWNQESKDTWILEQQGIPLPLSDWMVL